MEKPLGGFDFAAAPLLSMVGRRSHMDERLKRLADRMSNFMLGQSGDRVTAAIVIETEAKKCGLDDAELLLEVSAIVRRGP